MITQLPAEEAITRFTDCMDKICKMAKRVCKATVTAGIGHVCNQLSQLSLSYHGAKNATSYRVLYGNTRAINIAEMDPQESVDEHWEEAYIEKILKKVRMGEQKPLEEAIAEPRTIYPGDAAEPTADTEMPVGTIDGYDYIGYLSIPSIGLALPVMQQWSYPGLKIAPGRYSGSLYTDDLVIAGHNYARHFSPLTHLTVGTEVLFVDMNDNTWHYAVSDTEVLQPTQIEEMAVKTSESNWDLTLFTCTTTGQARYALRCVRTDE